MSVSPGENIIHVVEPGFNSVGPTEPIQALTQQVSMDMFDQATRDLLERGQAFTLVLGEGFENADVAAGFVAAPCKRLAGVEQLRFLQERGLQRIEMQRLHGTLAQNARAIGIEVIVRGQA